MQIFHRLLFGFVTYTLRLGSGVLVFVFIARALGPESFGQFAYWLALATLLSVTANFGFSTMILRSIGVKSRDGVRTVMGQVLVAKLALLTIPFFVAGIVLLSVPSPNKWVFLLLLGAQLSESFIEFYALVFRIDARFADEAKTASIVSAMHIISMGVVASYWPDLLITAAAFFGSRICGLLLTRWCAYRHTQPLPKAPLRTVRKTLSRSTAYAMELGLTAVYSQFDTVLITMILGAIAAGLYQAGMKLVQGAIRIVPVIAQVMLPELARVQSDPVALKKISSHTLLIYMGLGGAAGLVLTLCAAPITRLLFGPQFHEVERLLPLFGLLVFFQFTEAAIGLIVVARGMQSAKAWSVAAHHVMLVLGGTWLLHLMGLAGWQWMSIISLIALMLLYLRLLRD